MTAQQLKNSILQMAVQGKLVPQDPNDEPASVLLERIRAEKERLIKEKKIKREKNPSVIFKGADNTPYEKIGDEVRSLADEVPFDIPDSWEWVRLGSIVYNRGQITPSTDFCYIDIGSIDNKKQKLNPTDTVIAPDKAPSRARKLVDKGDVLYSTVRPYLHNMCIVDRDFSCIPIASTGFAVLTCHAELCNKFLFYYMMSPDFDAYANNTDNAKGVAYPAINDDRLYKALIPIPPLGEQFRIVSAIESVDASIRDYGAKEEALRALNGSFPECLKKSILQEAVQGKLVPQDPSDEPAEALLERIRAEKQRLIKEDKIKKDKHESVIFRRDNSHYEKLDGVERCIDDELPFEIPDSWEWVRLGTVFQHNTGKALNASNRDGEKLTYITTSNLYWDRFVLENLKTMPFTDSEVDKCTVQQGDLLVCEGGDIGRAAIWESDEPMRIQNHIHRLRAYVPVCTRFFYHLFYLYKGAGWIGGKGIAIQGLSSNAIHNLLFPLPPLHEQERIVNAIDTALSVVQKL
ncbi:MAG TPA: restriction endonuclease subunit S [Clostridiales bacterium]|nr:restriction endonuclease subunit S [Clostridiales bacterium]